MYSASSPLNRRGDCRQEELVPAVPIQAISPECAWALQEQCKSYLRNYLHPLRAAERFGVLHRAAPFGPLENSRYLSIGVIRRIASLAP